MPRLVIEKGPAKGRSVRIDKTSAVLVGRSGEADLQLDNPMASRKHFSVEFKGGKFYIIDTNSANGTYLNGERIRQHVLEIGDKVQAGEVLLSFMTDKMTIRHDSVTGQQIAGYLIEERIGRGAMGTVYKATQLSLDRPVALKMLAKELLRDRNFIDMFVREAQNAGQLNHPNIVQVYDVGHYKNIYYYSMEYMAAGSVYEMINREGPLHCEKAVQIAADSARGLLYAEKRALVHRDIKPENLMLSPEGTTKIGDLGIARRLHAGSTVKEEGIFGSPHYMAPEQAQGLKIDCRSDIYSLGATMYHILSGKTPFSGKSPEEIIIKQIDEEPRALLEVNPMVPPRIADIVKKCMQKNPDGRYQSAHALLEDLEAIEAELAAKSRRMFVVRLAAHVRKKHLVALIVILIAAAAATAGFFTYQHYQASAQAYALRESEAEIALAAAQALLDAGKVDDALKAVEKLKADYAEFAGVVTRAQELALKAKKLKEESAALALAQKAQATLTAAREFEKSNPDKLEEAAGKYAKVALDFPDTGAAKEALSHRDRIHAELGRRRMFEQSARATAEMTLKRASRFKATSRFGKALAELDGFPQRFGQTAAAKEIAAERRAMLEAARRAFEKVKREAARLLGAKMYRDARLVIFDAANKFDVPEITADASKFVEKINKTQQEHKKQIEAADLARDEKAYSQSVVKARALIREHRFESAAFEYGSLVLLLDTEQYRRSARRKKEEVRLIESAKETLINQINSKTLARPIELEINNMPALAFSATKDELALKFKAVKGEAPRPWKSFTPSEMAGFLSACKLDAGGHLAAAVYCKELGESGAARKHFDTALEMDPALKDRVGRFSGDLK